MLLSVAVAATLFGLLRLPAAVWWSSLALPVAATDVPPVSAPKAKLDHGYTCGEIHRFLASVDAGLSGRRVASFPPYLVRVSAVCFLADCTYLGGPRLAEDVRLESQLRALDIDVLVIVGERSHPLPRSARLLASSEPLGNDSARYEVYDPGEL